MLKFYSRLDLSVVFSSWDLLAPELHRKMLNFTDRFQLQLGSFCEVEILLLRPKPFCEDPVGPNLSANAVRAFAHFIIRCVSYVKCLCWSLGHADQFLFSCLSSKVTAYR